MRINHFSLFVILCLGVHRSAGNWIIDSFSIDEGYDGRFPYSLGVVKVDNKHTEFKILGQGVDVEPKGILQINEKTGEVTVHGPVDYEKYNVLKCTFKAYDVLKNVVDTKLGIEIVIMDANDNAPKFELALYKISIAESTMQGTEVISVLASDSDFTEHNRKINFTIVSVNPPPSKDLEFYLIHKDQTAAISFHGCLDHETADKYTIIVEAKDNGIKKQLSSSTTVIITIEDGNNHVPEIIKLTGTGKVKEGMENVLVSRLHVKDADTKGTMAWKALYRIHGDTHNYFKISTDPETNDGLLYVQKHLDFEDNPLKNVTISVENEISSHSCRLISRSKTGEWEVQMSAGAKVGGFSISGDTITGISSTGTTIYGTSASSTFSGFSGGIVETLGISTYVVTVTVEDVNEAPIFDKSKLQVTLSEFVKVGYYLETVTAKDPDVNSGNTFKYIIGHDPARWIAVDPVTGKITTAKNIDRESTFVVNNIYNATVLAVDNGKPQMTGTATLSIRITDENDNTPFLTKSTIDMCQSDGPSLANITAVDLDEDPYSGPFTFKLLGDVEGKWRLESSQGYSVNLVKESTVHSGISDLLVQVFDLQEENAVHNLTVTVCNCVNPAMPHCTNRQAVSSTPGAGLLGLIFLSILLIAVLLLLAFLVSCKKRTLPFPDEPMGQGLIKCNIEKPGTDCQVIFEDLTDGQKIVTGTEQNKLKGNANTLLITEQQRRDYLQWLNLQSTMDLATGTSQDHWRKFLLEQQHYNGFTRRNSTRWTMGGVSTMKGKYQDKYFRQKWAAQYSAENEIAVHREILFKVLNKAQHTLEAPGEELGDYAPHVYAEEGDTETLYELDAISIADTSFDLDLDLNQNYKFNTLASICMPCESAACSANTYYVLETFNTATEIQTESQNTNMNTQLLSTNCIFDQVINPTF
ncbi:cadherin-like protein 26 isoform X2 [Larimichthys crocea]|uniref:cadherin-like protein 26 isoform X2 n=1 Tax=Larimichthys crocea TaxID=215358 RepID=UPI000F5DA348|nr:cadherin-1 isoform X2 [Larimichthys crocea]